MVGDQRFDLNNIDSYELIAKHIQNRSSPLCTILRNASYNPDHIALTPSFKIDCGLSDVTKKKSKDYYSLYVRKKFAFQITREI